jgi:hypothetical protein
MLLEECDFVSDPKNPIRISSQFQTFYPLQEEGKKTRVLGLVKEGIKCSRRDDLMSLQLLSVIWPEIERAKKANLLLCGVYREWGTSNEELRVCP